jgi:hypothetical protein
MPAAIATLAANHCLVFFISDSPCYDCWMHLIPYGTVDEISVHLGEYNP